MNCEISNDGGHQNNDIGESDNQTQTVVNMIQRMSIQQPTQQLQQHQQQQQLFDSFSFVPHNTFISGSGSDSDSSSSLNLGYSHSCTSDSYNSCDSYSSHNSYGSSNSEKDII